MSRARPGPGGPRDADARVRSSIGGDAAGPAGAPASSPPRAAPARGDRTPSGGASSDAATRDATALLRAVRAPEFQASVLTEPQLVFGGHQRLVDPKTGLGLHGPFDLTDPGRPAHVRVGLIGTGMMIDRTRAWIERCRDRVAPYRRKGKTRQLVAMDPTVYTTFPGTREVFAADFVVPDALVATLRDKDVHELGQTRFFEERVTRLVDLLVERLRVLSDKATPPDVVIVALPAEVRALCTVASRHLRRPTPKASARATMAEPPSAGAAGAAGVTPAPSGAGVTGTRRRGGRGALGAKLADPGQLALFAPPAPGAPVPTFSDGSRTADGSGAGPPAGAGDPAPDGPGTSVDAPSGVPTPRAAPSATLTATPPAGPASSAGGDEHATLHHALKARAMEVGLRTQLLWQETLEGTSVQDEATRAWNFWNALYYKAGGIPWRAAGLAQGTCFVGVAFYRDRRAGGAYRTCMAQAFSDEGEGFVLRSDPFKWDDLASPHLTREVADDLMTRVLAEYEAHLHHLPRRVVVHKGSRYWPDERAGFEAAVARAGVHAADLVAFGDRDVRFFRAGQLPPLRNTLIQLGPGNALLYTQGYTPFSGEYGGMRVPRPLEIIEHVGSASMTQIAQEILTLSKLDYNTTAFSGRQPITTAFSREIGEILAELPEGATPKTRYWFYM